MPNLQGKASSQANALPQLRHMGDMAMSTVSQALTSRQAKEVAAIAALIAVLALGANAFGIAVPASVLQGAAVYAGFHAILGVIGILPSRPVAGSLPCSLCQKPMKPTNYVCICGFKGEIP
jgi:hypothetical protein